MYILCSIGRKFSKDAKTCLSCVLEHDFVMSSMCYESELSCHQPYSRTLDTLYNTHYHSVFDILYSIFFSYSCHSFEFKQWQICNVFFQSMQYFTNTVTIMNGNCFKESPSDYLLYSSLSSVLYIAGHLTCMGPHRIFPGLSLIHISSPRDRQKYRMPSSA